MITRRVVNAESYLLFYASEASGSCLADFGLLSGGLQSRGARSTAATHLRTSASSRKIVEQRLAGLEYFWLVQMFLLILCLIVFYSGAEEWLDWGRVGSRHSWLVIALPYALFKLYGWLIGFLLYNKCFRLVFGRYRCTSISNWSIEDYLEFFGSSGRCRDSHGLTKGWRSWRLAHLVDAASRAFKALISSRVFALGIIGQLGKHGLHVFLLLEDLIIDQHSPLQRCLVTNRQSLPSLAGAFLNHRLEAEAGTSRKSSASTVYIRLGLLAENLTIFSQLRVQWFDRVVGTQLERIQEV